MQRAPSLPASNGVVPFGRTAPRVATPSNAPPVLILPGFGNAASDYATRGLNDEPSLVEELESRGFTATVVPIARNDWFKVASCLLSPGFWRGAASPRDGYGFYLDAAATSLALLPSTSPPPMIIGHSAGGWLALALLAELGYETASGLVSLGTPHTPRGDGRCVTRGALAAVAASPPPPSLPRIAVAGRLVRGDPTAPRGSLPARAAAAYGEVGGAEAVGEMGDGVVPTATALALPDALHLTLDGVGHAPRSDGGVWYGSGCAVDLWLEPALAAVGETAGRDAPTAELVN